MTNGHVAYISMFLQSATSCQLIQFCHVDTVTEKRQRLCSCSALLSFITLMVWCFVLNLCAALIAYGFYTCTWNVHNEMIKESFSIPSYLIICYIFC